MALRAFPHRLHHAHISPPHLISTQPIPVPPRPRTTGSGPRTGAGSRASRGRRFSAESVSHPSNRVQVYLSRSADPHLNLSIEHFLLQRSPPDSVVLFLYANRPCVVIGRNQNPWVEADLGLLGEPGVLARLLRDLAPARDGGEATATTATTTTSDDDDDVLLVRRRSGGGAVFHDSGNVNYSVICPPASFDRDKHAGMVVRALRRLGVPGARVNERHDIVLDAPAPAPVTTTAAAVADPAPATATYKISGSAYKLTRLRSLHHGTCLLDSPHLPLIGRLLRSPAAPYVRARGVESVRSPVRNVGVRDPAAFEDAVVAEFAAMYGGGSSGAALRVQVLGGEGFSEDRIRGIPDIRKGWDELRSPEWTYAQTPQFTFSTHPTADDPRPRSGPPGFRMSMTVRHGQVTECSELLRQPAAAGGSGSGSGSGLVGTHLHRVGDWRDLVPGANGRWLNGLFGVAKGS